MNAEWIASWPGTAEEKQYASGCVACHSLETTTRTRHDARQWLAVLRRMSLHPNGSSLLNAVRFSVQSEVREDIWARMRRKRRQSPPVTVDDEGVPSVVSPRQSAQAGYLASINLGPDRTVTAWKYDLKTLPRPDRRRNPRHHDGIRSPRRSTQPHDATVDAEGMVWFEDFGDNYVGRLNPTDRRGQGMAGARLAAVSAVPSGIARYRHRS